MDFTDMGGGLARQEKSVDDTGTDRGKIWLTCGADGKTGGSDRTVKGTGSNALGAENELH